MTKLADTSQLPRNSYHQFYVDKFRVLSITAERINKDLEDLKKLAPLRYKGLIKSKFIKGLVEPPKNSLPRKSGVVIVTNEGYARKPIIIRPDQKRCQKRLINKGQMDMEYLQQVVDELLSSKEIAGMTSGGTQELNDLIKSMTQRIQHGSKNRKEEMKIHDKLRDLKITREVYTEPEPIRLPSYNQTWWHCAYYGEKNAHRRGHRYSYKQLKNFEILEKDRMGYKIKVMGLLAMSRDIKRDIYDLEYRLGEVNFDRRITYNLIRMLCQLQESCYDEYQSLSLDNVKNLAKVVPKVKQLCDTKVEGFKARWNENEAFRDDFY